MVLRVWNSTPAAIVPTAAFVYSVSTWLAAACAGVMPCARPSATAMSRSCCQPSGWLRAHPRSVSGSSVVLRMIQPLH